MIETEAPASLAGILSRNREAIQARWTDSLRVKKGSRYAQRPWTEIHFWVARGVGALIESLETGSSRPLEAHVLKVSRVRASLGFDISEVIEGFLLLKPAVLPFILDVIESKPREAARLIDDLDDRLCAIVSRFGAQYAASMTHRVESEMQRTALLLEATKSAGHSLDLEVVLQRVTHCIAAALEASCACLFLADEASGVFRHQVAVGDPTSDELLGLLSRPLLPEADPVVASVVSRRQPVLFDEADPSPFVGEASCGALGIASAVALPVMMRTRVLAVAIVLSVDRTHAFSPKQIELAMGVANAVAPAVDHARLYAESRRNLAESRTLQRITNAVLEKTGLSGVFELVCRETRGQFGASGSAVLLLEDDDRLRLAYSSGDATEHANRLVREVSPAGESVVPVEPVLINGRSTDDTVQSMLAVPVRVHDHDVGILLAVDDKRGFGGAELGTIRLFADQLAVAIEHARLHEQQERMAVMEERQRLARDLHDSATQSVYGITVFAEAAARLLESGDPGGAAGNLRELREAARKALRQMRHLVFELHPADIGKEGLVATLRARLSAVESRAGIRTEFHGDDVKRFPLEIEEGLYGIAQEAFNNSVKHARASRLSMRLERFPGGVVLEIEDDGLGFDLEAGKSKGGMGLRGMEQRAARLNGEISITTGSGMGTRIAIEVPLPPDPQVEE